MESEKEHSKSTNLDYTVQAEPFKLHSPKEKFKFFPGVTSRHNIESVGSYIPKINKSSRIMVRRSMQSNSNNPKYHLQEQIKRFRR